VTEISNFQLEQIAGPELTVDAKIEQRQFPLSAKDLKPDADSPNLLQFERGFLTNKFALVPRLWNHPNIAFIHSRLLKIEEP
jgi:hypothetical protein